jgi:hypothetical protein
MHVGHQEHRCADREGERDQPSHREAILGRDDFPLVRRGLSGEPREPVAMERRRRHQQDGCRSCTHQRHDVDRSLAIRRPAPSLIERNDQQEREQDLNARQRQRLGDIDVESNR